MDINTLTTAENDKRAVILEGGKPTGEQPIELLSTEEHTEHYLALQRDLGSIRGIAAGKFGAVALWMLGVQMVLMYRGEWDEAPIGLITTAAVFFIPFLWEALRPLPFPIIFNRRTREVYFNRDGDLYHAPWDGISAIAHEFQIADAQVGSMQKASLEIRVWKFEQPETALMISLGAPFDKSLALQKGFWEYLRSYMNNGPYFDKHGNHSESNEFVQSQLDMHPKINESLKDIVARIKKAKKDSGGRNYLDGNDVALLIYTAIFYPKYHIHEFTYDIAKRLTQDSWPSIVTQRLKANGPTTRLVDLELEQGMNVSASLKPMEQTTSTV